MVQVNFTIFFYRVFPHFFFYAFVQGLPLSETAVETMLKMMKNMTNKASEDKFKRIRLGNANFNSKVGSVDGGIEVSRRTVPRPAPIDQSLDRSLNRSLDRSLDQSLDRAKPCTCFCHYNEGAAYSSSNQNQTW